MNKHEEQPFFCDLTAIPADMREKHLTAVPAIFQAAQDVTELPNGLAFRFQNEPGRFRALANFVEYEQLCCPFEGLAVEIEPNGGSIWLRLTGGAGYKAFLADGLRDMRSAASDIHYEVGDEAMVHRLVEETAVKMTKLLDKAVPNNQ